MGVLRARAPAEGIAGLAADMALAFGRRPALREAPAPHHVRLGRIRPGGDRGLRKESRVLRLTRQDAAPSDHVGPGGRQWQVTALEHRLFGGGGGMGGA